MVTSWILILVMNAFWIIGLNRAFYYTEDTDGVVDPDSKMILWKIHHAFARYVPVFWLKPLFRCPPCMASVHSVYWFLPFAMALTTFTWEIPLLWIVYVVILSGIVSILNGLAE